MTRLIAMNLDALIAQELDKKFFALASTDGDELPALKKLFDGDPEFYVGTNRLTAHKISLPLPRYLCAQHIDRSPISVYTSLVSLLATYNKLPEIKYSIQRLDAAQKAEILALPIHSAITGFASIVTKYQAIKNGALLAAAHSPNSDTLAAMSLLIDLGACPTYVHEGTGLSILDAATLSGSLAKVQALVIHYCVLPTRQARDLAYKKNFPALVTFFDQRLRSIR